MSFTVESVVLVMDQRGSLRQVLGDDKPLETLSLWMGRSGLTLVACSKILFLRVFGVWKQEAHRH